MIACSDEYPAALLQQGVRTTGSQSYAIFQLQGKVEYLEVSFWGPLKPMRTSLLTEGSIYATGWLTIASSSLQVAIQLPCNPLDGPVRQVSVWPQVTQWTWWLGKDLKSLFKLFHYFIWTLSFFYLAPISPLPLWHVFLNFLFSLAGDGCHTKKESPLSSAVW